MDPAQPLDKAGLLILVTEKLEVVQQECRVP